MLTFGLHRDAKYLCNATGLHWTKGLPLRTTQRRDVHSSTCTYAEGYCGIPDEIPCLTRCEAVCQPKQLARAHPRTRGARSRVCNLYRPTISTYSTTDTRCTARRPSPTSRRQSAPCETVISAPSRERCVHNSLSCPVQAHPPCQKRHTSLAIPPCAIFKTPTINRSASR